MSDLEVFPHLTIPEAEIVFRASRSSGPGGQHANKTSSRISLLWSVMESRSLTSSQRSTLLVKLGASIDGEGTLVLHCEETRSQHQNKERAKERLVALVRNALTPRKARKKTRPSRSQREKRRKTKRHRSRLKAARKRPREHDDES